MDDHEAAQLVVVAFTTGLGRTAPDPDALIHGSDEATRSTGPKRSWPPVTPAFSCHRSTGDGSYNAATGAFWATLKRQIATP